MTTLLERDAEGVAHVVGLSGGHDSTILAVLLKERDPETPYNYVCTPTGDELPEMFQHWRDLGERLGRRLLPILGGTLKSAIQQKGGGGGKVLPNFRLRYCTRILKIEPYQAFLEREAKLGPIVSYIGLRADEPGRAGGDYGEIDGVTMRFPLREWGMDDPAVLQALADRGIRVPNRTDCARCYHQRIGEWFELWRDHRDIFLDAAMDEVETGSTYRTPGRDSYPTRLLDMDAEFAAGRVPETSLARLAREREAATRPESNRRIGQCAVCVR